MTSSKDGEGGESSGLTVVSSGHASGGAECERCRSTRRHRNKLAVLRQEHRELDEAILALTSDGVFDQLQLTRLKKRKLMLRDQISRIEDDNVPDIIA